MVGKAKMAGLFILFIISGVSTSVIVHLGTFGSEPPLWAVALVSFMIFWFISTFTVVPYYMFLIKKYDIDGSND